ncbi:hypothetical protein IAR50_006267 [Cryptococcus sp. DSM 104548]
MTRTRTLLPSTTSDDAPEQLVLRLRAQSPSIISSSSPPPSPRSFIDPPNPPDYRDSGITLYTTTYLTRGASILPSTTTAPDQQTSSMIDRYIPPAGRHSVAWRVDADGQGPDEESLSKVRELESILKERFSNCSLAGHELKPFLKGFYGPPAYGDRSRVMSMITKTFDRTLKDHGTQETEMVLKGLEGREMVKIMCVSAQEFEEITGSTLERLDMSKYNKAIRRGRGVLDPQ